MEDHTNEYTGKWIETYSGLKFHFMDPKPEEISIGDIAHALVNICRFTGHTSRFYSVGEHSLLVCRLCPVELRLEGLLHDASEAYIADISRPLKNVLPEYRKIESNIMKAISEKFELDFTGERGKIVKNADLVALATESRDLMPNMDDWKSLPKPLDGKINFLEPKYVELTFKGYFNLYRRDYER